MSNTVENPADPSSRSEENQPNRQTAAGRPYREAFMMQRPEGISDRRWDGMQVVMVKVATGHYPWCDDHADEEDGDYCHHIDSSHVGDVILSSGTRDGVPLVFINVGGTQLNDLTINDAAVLAVQIETVKNRATRANFTQAALEDLQ